MGFDIWLLLAGVGILLFGMNIFEEGIKELAGNKMKFYLEKYTKGPLRSLGTGAFVTGILQSSSLVSLLLLGFVGAGIMMLPNAIGVIIGANIGTTLSSLYVSLLGFGKFSISSFAMPVIALGGLLIITAGSNKKRLWRGKLMVGFGLLFIGIDFMKESVEQIKDTIDIANYASMSLWGFGLLGVIVTLVIQSSSTTSVLTFTALASGIISFPASVAIVMGANIGTTATSVIASLGGKTGKRQLAFAQVVFNLFSAIIGIIFFWQYISLANWITPIENDPVFANAVLNAIFNTSTAILFGFFLTQFTALVRRIVPDEKIESQQLRIHNFGLNNDVGLNNSLLLAAAEDDIKGLLRRTLEYNTTLWKTSYTQLEAEEFIPSEQFVNRPPFDNTLHRSKYDGIQSDSAEIIQFLHIMHTRSVEENDQATSGQLDSALLSLLSSMKHSKNMRHTVLALDATQDTGARELYEMLWNQTMHLYRQLVTITSRHFTTDNISEITQAVEKTRLLYSDNISLLNSLNLGEDDTNLDIASLINATRELYDSVRSITKAVGLLYLSHDEIDLLEKVL